MAVDVLAVVDAGLGNTSWLVDLGDGRALVVDPPRDLRAVRAAAGRRRLAVAFAAETHLHADFLTGAVDLAAQGAQVLASAAGERRFGHRRLVDGDEVGLGGLRLRALATAGHTDEHLSFVLLDGPRPVGVFTGGSLLVGAAARTDLVHPDRTRELARAQWRSLLRLAELPDDAAVWPTHGAGSFCAAAPGGDLATSIGREKRDNPLLRAGSAEEFAELLLGSLGEHPPYFRSLGEVNRTGPRPLPADPALPALTPDDVARARREGALVVDVRPAEAFAAAHLPASLSIPLRPAFGTWLGWVADPAAPMVFVRDAGQDREEMLWQAFKIGFDRLVGELVGLAGWTAAGQPVSSTPVLDASRLGGRPVVDVRQGEEFRSGHVRGAVNVALGRLAEGRHRAVPSGAAVMCGHGERAMTAASLLERAGRADVAVVLGGPQGWARGTAQRLDAGA